MGEMEEQRALLDALMGRNRDGDRPEEDISDFRHSRVCKAFLCGLCPHELFQNTRVDLGACPLLHLPALKAAYEAAGEDFGYELALETELGKFLAEADRKIRRAQKRLEEQDGARPVSLLDAEDAAEVKQMSDEIQKITRQAEEAGGAGDADAAAALMDKVQELKRRRADAQADAMIKTIKAGAGAGAGAAAGEGAGPDAEPDAAEATGTPAKKSADGPPTALQKLRVCDICGAFLSIYDSDRRLADHFGGKLHIGYVQIRRKMKEIAEKRREQREQRRAADSNSQKREDSDKRRASDSRSSRPSRSKPRSRSRSRSRPRFVFGVSLHLCTLNELTSSFRVITAMMSGVAGQADAHATAAAVKIGIVAREAGGTIAADRRMIPEAAVGLEVGAAVEGGVGVQAKAIAEVDDVVRCSVRDAERIQGGWQGTRGKCQQGG